MVYDDVEAGQRDPREKDDKYKTWMPKFLMSRDEKDRRKSSDDVDRSLLALSVFPVLSDFVWGVS